MAFSLPNQAPAHTGFADLGDARLWYSDTGGDGEPIVLCHPASQSAAIWSYQQPAFVAAGYRVIAYSRRGYGCSEKGPTDSTGTSVGDLVALLDKLDVAQAHILGAAAGGITALAFAIAHPGRTLSAILAGTIFSINEDEWRAVYHRLGINAVRDAVSTEFLELGPTYRLTNPEGTKHFAELSAAAHRNAPQRQPSGVDVTWAKLEQLTRPVLLVTGEADLYAPPPLQALIASHIPNAETKTFREVGHAPYWEQSDGFNDTALRFLKQQSAFS
jgi:pimeloyl-ACP methyl ester carboxylesterase